MCVICAACYRIIRSLRNWIISLMHKKIATWNTHMLLHCCCLIVHSSLMHELPVCMLCAAHRILMRHPNGVGKNMVCDSFLNMWFVLKIFNHMHDTNTLAIKSVDDVYIYNLKPTSTWILVYNACFYGFLYEKRYATVYFPKHAIDLA